MPYINGGHDPEAAQVQPAPIDAESPAQRAGRGTAHVRRPAQPISAARRSVEASEGRPEAAPRTGGRTWGGYTLGSGMGGGFMLGSGN
jgi:hypothetical protein